MENRFAPLRSYKSRKSVMDACARCVAGKVSEYLCSLQAGRSHTKSRPCKIK